MALYPKAVKLLLPENTRQTEIKPTQFIVHSMAAPWTVYRLYEFWRDSTNNESTFGIEYSGMVAQYMDTTRRADANYQANPRAISVETASKPDSTDPWTPAQVDSMADLFVWASRTHKIPLAVCETWYSPGFGWHNMFSEWGRTACPGRARIQQFPDVLDLARQRAAASPGYTPPPFPRGLRPGRSRPSAKPLQRALKAAGYMPVSVMPSDHYGPRTQEAVIRFHKANPIFADRGRPVDPAIGPKGWAHLHREAYAGAE